MEDWKGMFSSCIEAVTAWTAQPTETPVLSACNNPVLWLEVIGVTVALYVVLLLLSFVIRSFLFLCVGVLVASAVLFVITATWTIDYEFSATAVFQRAIALFEENVIKK